MHLQLNMINDLFDFMDKAGNMEYMIVYIGNSKS